MTDVAAYINTAFYLPTGTNAIKFSQIREMYGNQAGTAHASKTFSGYYRNGSIVTSTSYDTGDYKATNEAGNITVSITPTTPLKMSQFRGAAKEFVNYISGAAQEVTGPPASILYKRIYKMVINGNLYRADTNQSALILNSPNANAIFIIQNESTMYGGGGAGGAGGAGGTYGVGGAANPGASTYVNGTAGGGGTAAGGGSDAGGGYNGGHCLEVTAYHAGQPLYLFNKGTLKPGGGGGGGTGGGGGSGGGGAGGSGGKGAEGRYNAAGGYTYTYAGYNPVGSTESFWRVLTLTNFIHAGTHNYGNIYWLGSRKLYLELSSTLNGYFFGDDPRGTGSGTGSEGYQYRRGHYMASQGNPSTIFLYSLARLNRVGGGNGGYGGGGRFGSNGLYGPNGKKGAYYNGSNEVIDTTGNAAVTGGAIQGNAIAGIAGGASSGITTYHWTANGAGGAGGAGGRSRAGFGYTMGGGGGGFGAAGTAGGVGVDGTNSYSEGGIAGGDGGLKTGDQNPWNERTVGGTGGSGSNGGAGGSGKPGGLAGQKVVLPSGITTMNVGWT
ncbi:MAG: hypothetical protein ACKVI4_17950 [Actinomycetales bacterium]|tara:strand:- start:35 stop:1696 length:1662 start_codon:yes stop_codon:yes gene_type:complete